MNLRAIEILPPSGSCGRGIDAIQWSACQADRFARQFKPSIIVQLYATLSDSMRRYETSVTSCNLASSRCRLLSSESSTSQHQISKGISVSFAKRSGAGESAERFRRAEGIETARSYSLARKLRPSTNIQIGWSRRIRPTAIN